MNFRGGASSGAFGLGSILNRGGEKEGVLGGCGHRLDGVTLIASDGTVDRNWAVWFVHLSPDSWRGWNGALKGPWRVRRTRHCSQKTS